MHFYRYNSQPLELVPLGELIPDEEYVNDEGIKVRYIEKEGEDPYMKVIQDSELNQGESIENLTDKQLKLFWTLMKNKAK